MQGAGYRVQGAWCRVQGTWYKVLQGPYALIEQSESTGCGVQGTHRQSDKLVPFESELHEAGERRECLRDARDAVAPEVQLLE